MTRFLYIADTHLGAELVGFQQQKSYPEKLPEILSALCEQLSAIGGIDFILHGGDMVDSTTDDNIRAAIKAFDLPVPTYLCLGNHDLTEPDAVERWLKLAPQFFIGGSADFTNTSDDCVIHVAPNHWGEQPFYWNNKQEIHLSPDQKEQLLRNLNHRSDLPHILLTHSPVHGLPVAQTGFAEPYHSPNTSFTNEVTGLATDHKNLKCILGAHNHMNMRFHHDGIEFVTVSSLVETPFEFKLFEVTPQRIEMSTFSLDSSLPFDGEYDTSRSFVQGRPADRSFSMQF